MKISLSFLLFIAILCSCNKNRQEEEYSAQYIVDINNPVKISIEDFITDIDTIRLEVTDESLMKDILRVHIMDDKFYILSNNSTCIFIFDSKGKYLSKINDKGNGPKEYISIGSFEIDPVNERIIISDSFSRRIFIYNKAGNQTDVININFIPSVVASHKNGFIDFYSGGRQHHYPNPDMDNYNLHFWDSKGKFVSSAIKTETPKRIDINSSNKIFNLDNGNILFHPVLGSVIYKISDDSISPYYAFNNLSKYKLLTKEEKNEFEYICKDDNEKFIIDKENKGYLLPWGFVLELTDYVFFNLGGWNIKRYLYYSKKTSKTILIEPESMNGDKDLVEILMSYPKAVKGNRFYISPLLFYISSFKGYIKDEKLKTFFENTDFDSNPVIISFSINFPE